MGEKLNLEKLRELHGKATPGPWRATLEGEVEGAYIEYNVVLDEEGCPDSGDLVAGVYNGAVGKVAWFAKRHFDNAALIEYLANAVPAILEMGEECDRLRSETGNKIVDLHEELDNLSAQIEAARSELVLTLQFRAADAGLIAELNRQIAHLHAQREAHTEHIAALGKILRAHRLSGFSANSLVNVLQYAMNERDSFRTQLRAAEAAIEVFQEGASARIKDAIAELATLTAQLAEAREDGGRLDELERMVRAGYALRDHGPKFGKRFYIARCSDDEMKSGVKFEYKKNRATIREAIDAARRPAVSGEGEEG